MPTPKSLAVSLFSLLITFNSGIVLAAEEGYADFLPPIWPFILIVLAIFIFRKQLNCAPPIDLSDSDSSVAEALATPAPPTEEKIATEPETEPELEPAPELTTETIDLKDNSNQCQASTAKGTRCKRKNTLTEASVSIDGIVYLLTACAQHNNDALKPYPGLIK